MESTNTQQRRGIVFPTKRSLSMRYPITVRPYPVGSTSALVLTSNGYANSTKTTHQSSTRSVSPFCGHVRPRAPEYVLDGGVARHEHPGKTNPHLLVLNVAGELLGSILRTSQVTRAVECVWEHDSNFNYCKLNTFGVF